jgi:hypothetical protein
MDYPSQHEQTKKMHISLSVAGYQEFAGYWNEKILPLEF